LRIILLTTFATTEDKLIPRWFLVLLRSPDFGGIGIGSKSIQTIDLASSHHSVGS